MKTLIVLTALITTNTVANADMYLYEEETRAGGKIINITEEENPLSSDENLDEICKAGGNPSFNGKFCEERLKEMKLKPAKNPVLIKKYPTPKN